MPKSQGPKDKKKTDKAVAPRDGAPIAPVTFEARGIPIDDWLKEQRIGQQGHSLIFLLRLFAATVFATFLIFLLNGLGITKLPDEFMHWLGAATVGEVAGMVFVIVRKLWS